MVLTTKKSEVSIQYQENQRQNTDPNSTLKPPSPNGFNEKTEDIQDEDIQDPQKIQRMKEWRKVDIRKSCFNNIAFFLPPPPPCLLENTKLVLCATNHDGKKG